MKKFLALLLSALMIFSLVACGETNTNESGESQESQAESDTFELAVVTDVGQLMDGGFNQGTYEGVETYAKANNITYKYYQPANGADATNEDRVAAMRQAIKNGAKVIVAPGFLQQEAMETVAKESPEVKFVFVDGWAFGCANVTAIVYKEQESGYLAGYAAVKDGYTKLGGTFGGGGTNPACNRYAYGYLQGAKDAAEEMGVEVEVRLSFQYGDAFSASPELAAQMSTWYADGTEVVFSCGGSMVQSVISAAKETEKGKIIGVDTDQSILDERVITSAMKGLSVSVQKVLGEYYDGKWDELLADKASNLGAADDATGLPMDTSKFEKFTQADYDAVYGKIKDGTVTPDDQVADDCANAEFWTKAVEGSKVTVKYE